MSIVIYSIGLKISQRCKHLFNTTLVNFAPRCEAPLRRAKHGQCPTPHHRCLPSPEPQSRLVAPHHFPVLETAERAAGRTVSKICNWGAHTSNPTSIYSLTWSHFRSGTRMSQPPNQFTKLFMHSFMLSFARTLRCARTNLRAKYSSK